MKRYTNILGALVAAALLLSGCVKQEATWAPVNISFKPLIGHDTRAVESVPFPQDRSFNVWAAGQLNNIYLDKEEITYGSEGWVASKLWPRHNLSFAAYWPTEIPMEYSPVKGLQLKDFDCSKGNVDILIASTEANIEESEVVTLRFDHILSRVDFRMTHSLSEGMSVRLKKIDMIGYGSEGNYNVQIANGWHVKNDDFTYHVYDAGQTDGIDIPSGSAQYIGEEFYVIPQICTAVLEVTYELRYGSANWVPQTEVTEPLDTYWDPSKHYTYTLNLRMDKLTHTTGISSWDDKENLK